MLSSEGSRLAALILQRQTVICRAVDLDTRFEVLALLESTQEGCADTDAAPDIRSHFSTSRKRLSQDVALIPGLVDDLEIQIKQAWRRLDRVSPRLTG